MVHVFSPAVTAVELYRRVRIGTLPGGHGVLLYSVRAINRCVRHVAWPWVSWDTGLPSRRLGGSCILEWVEFRGGSLFEKYRWY